MTHYYEDLLARTNPAAFAIVREWVRQRSEGRRPRAPQERDMQRTDRRFPGLPGSLI